MLSVLHYAVDGLLDDPANKSRIDAFAQLDDILTPTVKLT